MVLFLYTFCPQSLTIECVYDHVEGVTQILFLFYSSNMDAANTLVRPFLSLFMLVVRRGHVERHS